MDGALKEIEIGGDVTQSRANRVEGGGRLVSRARIEAPGTVVERGHDAGAAHNGGGLAGSLS